jgi:hypothetical protein
MTPHLLRSLFATGLLIIGSVAVQAQTPPIKPGLWQVQTERETDGKKAPELGEHMKNMSPAMRERMQANMKQHGIDMSGPPGQMKMCHSRESLDQGRWQGEQGNCKTDITSRSSSTWKWHATCAQPPSVSDGEATFSGAEAYTVKNTSTMTLQGKTSTTKMVMNAKWLGADCGDLKPMAPPPRASAPRAKP